MDRSLFRGAEVVDIPVRRPLVSADLYFLGFSGGARPAGTTHNVCRGLRLANHAGSRQ